MTDSNEDKKQSVSLPSPQHASLIATRETARIQLPTRPLSNPAGPADPPSPLRTVIATTPIYSPTEETIRISAARGESVAVADEIKRKQPLVDSPPLDTVKRVNETPMSLCWSLLAASGAILILQIWNYLS
jgi:hypothetical protein